MLPSSWILPAGFEAGEGRGDPEEGSDIVPDGGVVLPGEAGVVIQPAIMTRETSTGKTEMALMNNRDSDIWTHP
jgi:hypothetical protein